MNPLMCPGCGGVADNGHDREMPPNPYYCTSCMQKMADAVGRLAEETVVVEGWMK